MQKAHTCGKCQGSATTTVNLVRNGKKTFRLRCDTCLELFHTEVAEARKGGLTIDVTIGTICLRCGGMGIIPRMMHTAYGKCFQCYGDGLTGKTFKI